MIGDLAATQLEGRWIVHEDDNEPTFDSALSVWETLEEARTYITALRLAETFAAELKAWLTPAEWAEVKRRNETDPRYAGYACASHDFCDANMAMDVAWREVIGGAIDADDEEQAALWNRAWDIARQRHLGSQ